MSFHYLICYNKFRCTHILGAPFLYPEFPEGGKQKEGFKPTYRKSQVADIPQLEINFHGDWQVRESRRRANEFAEMQARRRTKSRRSVEKSGRETSERSSVLTTFSELNPTNWVGGDTGTESGTTARVVRVPPRPEGKGGGKSSSSGRSGISQERNPMHRTDRSPTYGGMWVM